MKRPIFLFILLLSLCGLRLQAQIDTLNLTVGPCVSAKIFNIKVNHSTADTIRVNAGTNMLISFTITTTVQPCFLMGSRSVLVGYNTYAGETYAKCLYSVSEFLVLTTNTSSRVGQFHLPVPVTSGYCYLNIDVANEDLIDGDKSSEFGDSISKAYGNNTLAVIEVVLPGSGDDPWQAEGENIYYDEGNVGIGTASPEDAYKLSVNGSIRAKRVVVENGWADHVFAPDYVLPPLDSVQAHIRAHGHLPGIPSAAEIDQNGLDLGGTQQQMMAKIEELTLYMLQLKRENEALHERLKHMDETQQRLKLELSQLKTQTEE